MIAKAASEPVFFCSKHETFSCAVIPRFVGGLLVSKKVFKCINLRFGGEIRKFRMNPAKDLAEISCEVNELKSSEVE